MQRTRAERSPAAVVFGGCAPKTRAGSQHRRFFFTRLVGDAIERDQKLTSKMDSKIICQPLTVFLYRILDALRILIQVSWGINIDSFVIVLIEKHNPLLLPIK